MKTYARIERTCEGGTALCLGSGPSLTRADVDQCRGRVDLVIAVNSTYLLAPWADVLYAHDAKWWGWQHTNGDTLPLVAAFAGRKLAVESGAARWPGVELLRLTGEHGLETDPTALRHGKNSGYQAVNLSVHHGVRRILLLGYDMQGTHFHAPHPDQTRPPFADCLKAFATLADPLRALGVEIINCSRRTALTCFPRMALEDALAVGVSA